MSSLALINEFLGMPRNNASAHGYQIDQILEFCHWFMAALFVGWSVFFIYALIRFRKRRQPGADHLGVKSHISTHLEFSVVLIEAVLLIGFAIPLWARRVNEFPRARKRCLSTQSRSNSVSIITCRDPMGNLADAISALRAIQIHSASIRTIPPARTIS